MSILSRLARTASAYIRARMAAAPSRARAQSAAQTQSRRPPGDSDVPIMSGAPPIQRPPRPPTGNAPSGDDDYDDIEIFGRDITSEPDGPEQIQYNLRLVSSSNVYGYWFMPETASMGILYVTFLEYVPVSAGGTGDRGNGPGATYGYYDFPLAKYRQFEAMAASSAGGAVWDYCRVRHSASEHQHTYRLVSTAGEYVPRKATADGFKTRAVANPGMGPRGFRRSQLDPQREMQRNRQLPQRRFANGQPNRGRPNRGEPNRG